MPAVSTTTQESPALIRTQNTSPPPLFNHSAPRKSLDPSPLGNNAFLWASEASGENGPVVDSSSEFFMTNFKAGSFQSLPHTNKSVVSSQGRERPHSRNGSVLSLNAGESRERTSKEYGKFGMVNGTTDVQSAGSQSTSLPNGLQTVRAVSPKQHLVNGDRPSTDGVCSEQTPLESAVAPSVPETNNTGLAPTQPPSRTAYRHSSPQPTPSTDFEHSTSPPSPRSSRLPHRSTLQVPRTTSGRRSLRDPIAPSPSDDTLATSDRFSTTSGFRRTSLTLGRRPPRSIQSDIAHPDELVPQDEDAARWTEAIKHRRASKRRRRDEEDDERVIVGTKVDHNHVNWVTAYNMLTGIRFTVSRTNAKLDRELTDADFEMKHKFSFDVTGNELTPSAKYDFKFKDYAPWVFRRLRAKFQLDPADYLMSLTSKYILSELGSPGKSGSFFYFSRDYKYIIKTIHHSEHKLLRRILRDYYEHIENNPNTLISQFYGLHRVKMAYGRKIHFVVMNNLFPPHRDIHQMFDLKGSTIGRDFREEDLESNPRATLKDLNWLRRNRHLELGAMKRQVFLAQLRRDVALLQRLKIMDYSLLVGIHDTERGNEENLRDKTLQVFQPGGDGVDEQQQPNVLVRTPSKLEHARKARELREMIKKEKPVPMEQTSAKMPDEILDERKNRVFNSDEGGLKSTHENGAPGDEIYYLGVIDCLTHYGFVKKLEHFWKGFSGNKTQISAIPPVAYGDRFIDFITMITKSKEEVEREMLAQERIQELALDGTAAEPGPSRSPAEKAMEKAEREAVKSSKTLDKQPEPRGRVLSTVRAPDSELSSPNTHLPVVEEVGEAASTGGRSGKSGGSPSDEPQNSAQGANTSARPRQTGLRTPSSSSLPTNRQKGKNVVRSNSASTDKELPRLPTEAFSSLPPSEMQYPNYLSANGYSHPK